MIEAVKTLVTVGTLLLAAALGFAIGPKAKAELSNKTLHCAWAGGSMTFEAPTINLLPDRQYELIDKDGNRLVAIPPFGAPCVIGTVKPVAVPANKQPPDIST